MKNRINYFFAFILLTSWIASSQLAVGQIKSSELDPKYKYTNSVIAEEYFKKGLTAYQNKNLSLAMQYYREALKLDSNYPVLLDNLGMCYSGLQKPDSAIYFFDRSIKIYPNGVFAMVSLGMIYSKQNRHVDALKLFTQALKIDPNLTEAYYGLAGSLLTLNAPKLALPYALKSMELYLKAGNNKFYGHAAYRTGICYSLLKDTTNAKLFFAKAAQHGTK